MANNTADFIVENHGSIFLLDQVSDAAQEWIADHIPDDDDHQFWAGKLVVEPRYIQPLVATLQAEGFVVR